MKVLDLHCAQGHGFEGWFASETDFVQQCERALVQCPLCGNASVTKKLSAPRLNLGARRAESAPPQEDAVAHQSVAEPSAAWLTVARHILANTTDVGSRFAEEARKMHYGETEERNIRGKTTVQEAKELVEEGVTVIPLVLPEVLKETLQ